MSEYTRQDLIRNGCPPEFADIAAMKLNEREAERRGDMVSRDAVRAWLEPVKSKRANLGTLAFEHGKVTKAKSLWRVHSTRSKVVGSNERTSKFVDWFASNKAAWQHVQWIMDNGGDILSVTEYHLAPRKEPPHDR